MDDFDLLYNAKVIIDKLANGINPLNGAPVAEDDVVNNVKITRCFFYVSDVLRKLIEKGGTVKEKKTAKTSFSITDEELAAFEYSDAPIALTHVIARINSLVNLEKIKKITYKPVVTWLKNIGLLEDSNGRYGKAKTCPTQQGEEMGISIEKRLGRSGVFFATYYNRNAQEFIVNHIQAISEILK